MTRKIEKAAHVVLTDICGPEIGTPAWLMRPGRIECRSKWPLVREIYRALTECELPDTMPPREWRRVDGVFRGSGANPSSSNSTKNNTSISSDQQRLTCIQKASVWGFRGTYG